MIERGLYSPKCADLKRYQITCRKNLGSANEITYEVNSKTSWDFAQKLTIVCTGKYPPDPFPTALFILPKIFIAGANSGLKSCY